MKYPRIVAMLLGAVLFAAVLPTLRAQGKGDFLTEEEEDKVREAQDPSDRIKLYLAIEQARLDRFETFRANPAESKYDNGGYLDKVLGQYISVTDELKNWIEDQYDRKGDMRAGLHALLEAGPKQLEQLRRIQQTPEAFTPDYKSSLKDAIDDLTDTLDGGTKALADQEKQFGAMKREQKEEAQAAKLREKEEKKKTKEENKIRKKEKKSGVPTDADQN
jgi:hypothetical protein